MKTITPKARVYKLKTRHTPLSLMLASRNTVQKPLIYFDEEKMVNRALRYATNQNSPFVDEQKGPATLGHIFFRNGSLMVPKQRVALQKLLSLYHPSKNKLYFEKDEVKEASLDLNYFEMELEALNTASELSLDEAEAVLRVEIGGDVKNMTSKEIKRDVILFARRNPSLFLKLMADDDTHLRSLGIKAVEDGIISLKDNKFVWASNGKKLMAVPFDEQPYSALASWFKTDDGMQVLESIQKKIK